MKKTPKYYYYNKSLNKWFVSKKINGTNIYLGKYNTEKEVQIAVKLFKKYGWDKRNNWRVKAEVKEILGNKEEQNGSSRIKQ